MNSDELLRPLSLGRLMLPNRVVMTAVKLGYGTREGDVTDRHVAFYARRARGGPGLIVTEPLYIRPDGKELPTQLGIDSDRRIEGLRRLVRAVHQGHGRVAAHLNHAGRAANPQIVSEGERVSASSVPCPANQVVPRPLTRPEIADVVSAFAAAARRARQAGFDALELPFSHGYLIHQFLSPHTNRRGDEYGGSLTSRLRLGREVLQAVRDELGPGFPIIVRMNATDYVDGGLTTDDAVPIASELARSGVDGLSVTSGTMCESVPYCLYPAGTPQANLLPIAARIRAAVSVPVIVAGRIRMPAVARKALAAGQADLIGLGRPFLADPDWVRKVAAGDEEAILLCAACHQGCLAELRKGHGTGCAFNPQTGREGEITATTADRARRVLVVGGGPAGMEAARVAAERGHQVVLCERESRLGGQLRLAAKPPHKEGFLDAVRHLELMARRAGVEVLTGTRVTAEMIRNARPDAVVLATGGVPLSLDFPGLDRSRWVLASDLLDGAVELQTDTAFVVGGGLVGLETADFLASQGRHVEVAEMLDEVGSDMDPLARTMLTRRLAQHGAEMHTGTRIVRLSENAVVARRGGREVVFPCETLVMAVGVRSNRELPEALTGSDTEIHVIGDAREPRKALEAIREGFEVACRL
jgi:2,4-dienoyl-CoA reductase-like NADH-dependent reductase (Old Yellow Enzyme family)/thioredoxin reductase